VIVADTNVLSELMRPIAGDPQLVFKPFRHGAIGKVQNIARAHPEGVIERPQF